MPLVNRNGMCESMKGIFLLTYKYAQTEGDHSCNSTGWVYFMLLLLSADFFQNQHFKILFQEHYQNVKQSGPRSGPTFFRS